MKLKKVTALLGLAMLPLLVPWTAQAESPHARVVELRDACDKATWDVEFPGLCTKSAGSVSLDEFRAKIPEGGSGAWWIRQRHLTLDAGDSIAATDAGGIVHSFTEVDQFGLGCVPDWNKAVSETVNNCDFGKFVATLVQPGATSTPEKLSVGVHKFQCLIHPWMRTIVTVEA